MLRGRGETAGADEIDASKGRGDAECGRLRSVASSYSRSSDYQIDCGLIS